MPQSPQTPPPSPSSDDSGNLRRGPFSSPSLRLALAGIAGTGAGAAMLVGAPHLFAPLAETVAPGWQAVLIAALIATLIARALMRLPLGLSLTAALFPIMAGAVFAADTPLWIYPLVLLIAIGVFWNVRSERVPLYLSNQVTIAALADLLPIPLENDENGGKAPIFVDLGSGVGGVVLGIARARPDANVIGVENAPLLYLISRIRLIFAGCDNARIYWRSIWEHPLGEADLVYAFLSEAPMRRLIQHVSREMRAGSLLVSNTFWPDAPEPERLMTLEDTRKTRLFVWPVINK